MSITTAQSVSDAYPFETAGMLAILPFTGPQSLVSPAGFSAIVGGANPESPTIGTATGVNYVTAGFDPVTIFLLTVTLRTTGQVWPITPN